MIDSRFGATAAVGSLFQLPGISPLVVLETRVVVAFVEVLEDGGEDLGEFFGQVDSFGGGFEELAAADGGEEGGGGEDVFVAGEQSLLGTDAESDDGRSQVAVANDQSWVFGEQGSELTVLRTGFLAFSTLKCLFFSKP